MPLGLVVVFVAIGFVAIVLHVISVALDQRMPFEYCFCVVVIIVAIVGYTRPRSR